MPPPEKNSTHGFTPGVWRREGNSLWTALKLDVRFVVIDDSQVSWDLWREEIVARPLSMYYSDAKPRPGLLLGFAAFTPDHIRRVGPKLAPLAPMVDRADGT